MFDDKNKIPLSFYQQEDVIETEAYRGADDRASHAYKNRRTKRTEVMFAEGGIAYVYLCYGLHHLFNIVTNKEEIPHAILIRAIKPEVGLECMLERRNYKKMSPSLTNGPGSLCQALGIIRAHNGILLNESHIWLEDRKINLSPESIQASPRIGIAYAGEDAGKPWRFSLIQ